MIVTVQFELACEEWRRSVIGFSRTLGTFLSLPLTGLVSDRWGRRTALALNAFNSAWLGLARRLAASYPAFLTLEVVEAVFGSGVFSCAYILGKLSDVKWLLHLIFKPCSVMYRFSAGDGGS